MAYLMKSSGDRSLLSKNCIGLLAAPRIRLLPQRPLISASNLCKRLSSTDRSLAFDVQSIGDVVLAGDAIAELVDLQVS